MKNKDNKKLQKFNYFNLIYAISTIILIVLVFINIAYFSYDLIDNFVIQIIVYSIISLYIILALVQMLIQTHIKEYRIMAYLTTLSTLISYCFSMFGLSVINTSLNTEPETYSYEVVEKDIQSGARQITRYILTVEINGKKIDIDISNDVYYEKEIGD